MKMETIAQLLTASLIVCAVCCNKNDWYEKQQKEIAHKIATRTWWNCDEQYTAVKWLHIGDSMVVPICGGSPPAGTAGKLDSVTYTYRGTEINSIGKTWYKFTHRLWSDPGDTWRTPYWSFTLYNGSGFTPYGISAMHYQLDNVRGDSVLFKVLYNYPN